MKIELIFIFFVLSQVLTYFSSKLENHPSQTLSVEDVLDTIRKELRDWPQDRLLVSVNQKPLTRSLELQCWGWFSRCPGCQLSNHVA